MRDLWLPVWIIARRELRDQLRDWRILFPLVVLTLFFPFLMIAATQKAVETVNQYGANLIADRMAPFFVMVVGFFPVTVSLVVALEAFVGEKERGTIEPLLSSPLQDWQMYTGKLLAGISVPLFASYMDIGFYLVLVYAQHITMPSAWLMSQMLVLTFVHAVLMVSAAILLSTQSTSVRGVNLLASFIVIPVTLLIQGETVLIFWGNNNILWLVVLGLLILSGLLMRVGLAHFRREALIGREMDSLNFHWAWVAFKKAFVGQATSLWSWYRREIPKALGQLRPSLAILLILAVFGSGGGYIGVASRADEIISIAKKAAETNGKSLEDVFGDTINTQELFPSAEDLTFKAIFTHNVQAITFMAFFGFFSFGVLGTLLFMVNMGIIGIVASMAAIMGYQPWLLILFGILPHGIFEIPALFIGAAVVLYIGALLVTPDGYRSLGEVLIESAAIWLKVTLGLVIPLLFVAALIETSVTPWLIQLFLKI